MSETQLNEGCFAKWREIDLGDMMWTLPGSRRKNVGPARLMPTTRQAVAEKLLETLGPREPDLLVLAGAGA